MPAVKLILKYFPDSKDDDGILLAHFWSEESKKIPTKAGFIHALANKELTSAETITRCRRKLQEENPELRGKRYYERQGLAEKVSEEMRCP